MMPNISKSEKNFLKILSTQVHPQPIENELGGKSTRSPRSKLKSTEWAKTLPMKIWMPKKDVFENSTKRKIHNSLRSKKPRRY